MMIIIISYCFYWVKLKFDSFFRVLEFFIWKFINLYNLKVWGIIKLLVNRKRFVWFVFKVKRGEVDLWGKM